MGVAQEDLWAGQCSNGCQRSDNMSSKNQFFIVVEEISKCRWIHFENPYEGSVDPGCIVVIRPCNDDNEFEVHRGSGIWSTPVLVRREGGLRRDKVVSITDQELDILLGTQTISNRSRLELRSSGRLKWACQLKAGDDVQVSLHTMERVAGVIKGSGAIPISRSNYGLHFIVEIKV